MLLSTKVSLLVKDYIYRERINISYEDMDGILFKVTRYDCTIIFIIGYFTTNLHYPTTCWSQSTCLLRSYLQPVKLL